MRKIVKMPELAEGKCQVCGCESLYAWNQYGALAPCIWCDSAPANIKRVEEANA